MRLRAPARLFDALYLGRAGNETVDLRHVGIFIPEKGLDIDMWRHYQINYGDDG